MGLVHWKVQLAVNQPGLVPLVRSTRTLTTGQIAMVLTEALSERTGAIRDCPAPTLKSPGEWSIGREAYRAGLLNQFAQCNQGSNP